MIGCGSYDVTRLPRRQHGTRWGGHIARLPGDDRFERDGADHGLVHVLQAEKEKINSRFNV